MFPININGTDSGRRHQPRPVAALLAKFWMFGQMKQYLTGHMLDYGRFLQQQRTKYHFLPLSVPLLV